MITDDIPEHKPTATGIIYGILIQQKIAVIRRRLPCFGVNLKYNKYIISTTANTIRENSADIAYRYNNINTDKINIVKPLGTKAHATDKRIAITGLLNFDI